MAEEEIKKREKKAIQIYFGREKQIEDDWNELVEIETKGSDASFKYPYELLQDMMESYRNNVKADSRNIKKIEDLQSEIEKLKEVNLDLSKRLEESGEASKAEIERLNADIINYRQSVEHDSEERELHAKEHISVPITELQRMCLDYMVEREKKNRHRDDITAPVFFMYCLEEMLIKGNKFSVNCVPDAVIHTFERKLKERENNNE